MKRKFTKLMAALALLVFTMPSLVAWGQVVSGTTYQTLSTSSLPTGWSGSDGGGTSYIKLIASTHYIQTSDFEQNGFTSITLKARKFGGPSEEQAKIFISWYDSENIETVLGTIDPTNTTLSDYTISSPATTNSGSGYIKIQCKGASSSKGSGVSEVTITFTEPGGTAPTTYTVTYNPNVTGVSSIVDTYNEGTNVTLRGANTFTNEGYTFSEWNTQANGEGNGYEAGEVINNIQASLVLYAIWTENTPSNDHWVLTSLADLTENDVFVIVGNGYAMTNDNGTSSAPATAAVTIANDEITSSVAANIQWTVSGDATNGYSFSPNGSTNTWLYCNTNASSSSNNNMRVGNGGSYDRKVFELNSNSYLLTKDSYTTRYLSIYNDADWRGYTNTSNGVATISFYKKVTGGVLPPSISAENVDIEYNATSGSITCTINNEPDPAGTLTADIKTGTTPTIADFNLGTVTGTTVPFSCSANTTGTAHTATVTLTYTYGDNQSATKDVTITQAADPNYVMTIAEARAQATGGAVTTKGVVTSIVGNTAYIQDANAAICVFGNNDHPLESINVGDEIKVSGTLSTYNNLLEITNPTYTVLTTGNIVTPTVMTIVEILESTNQGWFIKIEGATVGETTSGNTTLTQDGSSIVARNLSGATQGDVINLTGNISVYNTTKQIANPTAIYVPTLSINPTTANPFTYIYGQGPSEEQLFTVTGAHLTSSDITVTVTAGSEYFEITDDETYGSTVTIASSDMVSVRLKAGLETSADYAGTLTIASQGAQDVTVALTGSVTGQTYTIEQYSTPASAHGTITFAYEGPLYPNTTVTLNAEPADGYEFTANSWVFYNADNLEQVTLTVTDGNKINMPEYNLAVDATFTSLPTYAITAVAEPAEGGTVVTDETAWEGKTVEIAVEVNDGYALSSLTATYVDSNNDTQELSITNNTFVMPAFPVTVTATFVVNYDVTYDFSTAENFYTTAGGSVHPATGNTNNVDEFYYGNGDKFTASGTSHYFGSDNNHYFLFGKSGALVNLPTFAEYKVTQIIIHSSTGHSTNVNVAIVNGNNTVAEEQNWDKKDHDYTYSIPEQYQSAALSVKVTNAYNAQFTSITLVRELKTYTLTINGYTSDETKDGYYLIASPVTVNPAGNGMTTGDFDLYYFDQSQVGEEWQNYEANTFNLVPGKGYLYAKKGNETYNFTLTGTPYDGDGTISLTLSEDEGINLPGFNLVGNPFADETTFTTINNEVGGNPELNFLTMNEDGDGFIVTTASSFTAAPMQGFFVQATSLAQQLQVEEGTELKTANLNIAVSRNRGNVVDNAIVNFGNASMMNKFYLKDNTTRVYIPQGNQDFAVVRSAAEAEMPVSFKASENGTYTLAIETENVEMNYLHLIDNMTGMDVDLLQTPSYTFDAKTSDYASRFRLVFKANGTNENNAETFAYFNGSNWTVSNLGEATLQVVDVTGRTLSSETINGNATISLNQTPGVYMLRLVNGNSVKVQKVVVK